MVTDGILDNLSQWRLGYAPVMTLLSRAALVLTTALVFSGWMLYHIFLDPLRDVNALEPPVLKPGIPVIGHLIGLFRHHSHYLRILR